MGFFKKLGKAVGNAGGNILKGTVGTASAAGANIGTTIRRGANITSGILTGNTEKIQSNIKEATKEYGQNILSGAAAGAQLATGGLGSAVGLNIPKVMTSSELEKKREGERAATEEAAASAAEAARPEKERQALLNQQYQNSLLKSGGRKYNTLLGGGY